jgi:hypothetical protein
MISVNSSDLEQESKRLLKLLSLDGEQKSLFENRFALAIESFTHETAGTCVERYLEEELDFNTSGETGPGRDSADIPRFGGYYKKWLKTMEPLGVALYHMLMKECVLRGYLCRSVWEPENQVVPTIGTELLFERWMKQVYSTDPNDLGPELSDLMWACTEEPLLKLKGLIASNGLNRAGLLSKDKAATLMVFYPYAGYRLRMAQTGTDR